MSTHESIFYIALLNKSSQRYGESLAIWDHRVLPVTRQKLPQIWRFSSDIAPSINLLTYLLTSEHPRQTSWYSIYLPQRDRRLSWPSWMGMYRDGLPVNRQSPIQVVTVPGVKQLRWLRLTRYHYTMHIHEVLKARLCCRLESHLFSLSYPTFWLFSHLYSARAVTRHFGRYNRYYI